MTDHLVKIIRIVRKLKNVKRCKKIFGVGMKIILGTF